MKIRDSPCDFDIFAAGSTATIAFPNRHEKFSLHILMLYMIPGLHYIGGLCLAVVGQLNHVGLHDTAVDALPMEGIERKTVGIIPTKFAGDKVCNTATSHNLREISVVSKRVRNDIAVSFVVREQLTGDLSAVKKSSDQAFARREHVV
ncbi:hypothetical protein SDC9_105276 [bioreactor metagenome]|uniref:Uncharacterized protein n=1 Tax=bioreactor metagenome TaxID=1076179 RepID=A0A645AYX2_9ZZZZ